MAHKFCLVRPKTHHFFICEIDGRDVEIGEAPKMCVALAESYMSIVYCICQ